MKPQSLLLLMALFFLAPLGNSQVAVHIDGTARGPAYVVAGGTAQSQTVTLNPARLLVAGLEINFLPVANNTDQGRR
jgi:hypothetical protein